MLSAFTDKKHNFHTKHTKSIKPIYDPFTIFHPTKTFIREKIKILKQQAYELLNTKNNLQPDWLANVLWTNWLEPRHKKLCSRIREYEWRLENGNSAGAGGNGRIGETDIARAKAIPIADFYVGKLRKTGKTLVGLCPFHQEKTGSFTIYYENNRWTCFGACGIGGDVIDLVMKLNNLSFIEAVRKILHLIK